MDFREIRDQVNHLGERALQKAERIQSLYDRALDLLGSSAQEIDSLRGRAAKVVLNHDPNLRCALPVRDELKYSYPLPAAPLRGTVVAAD